MWNVQTDLLKGLPDDEAVGVMALGVRVTLAPGDVLFQLGAEADQLYLVVRGRIDLTLPMRVRDHDEDIQLEEKRPGETLGWSGLVPPHRFTLKATAPVECELLAFPRPKLLEHFEAHPAVGLSVMRNVAAVIGHRLQVFQTLWLREMQRVIELRYA